MNKIELENELNRRGIRPDAYDLNGFLLDDRIVLEHDGRGYVVFYYERGIRRNERLFILEEQACRDVLDRLMMDRSAFSR